MRLVKHNTWVAALLAMVVMLVTAASAMADQGSPKPWDAGSAVAAVLNQSTDVAAAVVPEAADQGTGEPSQAAVQTSPSAEQASPAADTAGQPQTPTDTTSQAQTPADTGSQAQGAADTTSQGQTPADTGQAQTQAGTTSQVQTPGDVTTQSQTPGGTGSQSQAPVGATTQPQTPADTTSQPQTPADTTSQPQTPADTTSQPQTPADTTSQPRTPEPEPSNSTVQQIWQVQTLGCTAHCQGTSQTQSAQQVNLTVEPAGPGDSTSTPSDTSSQHQTNVTQIQLGCLADCFGSTTVTDGASGGPDALNLLLNSPPPPDLPTQDPVAAPEQSVVQQSSYQSQVGQSSQLESATQVNVLAQDPIASLTSLFSGDSQISSVLASLGSWVASLGTGDDSPQSTPTSSPATTGPVINQVEQAIWQIQVGCLVFCFQTDQTQQAEQSDTTIGVIPATDPADSSPTTVSPIAESYQLVWQLQIGCLFFCYGTIETQIATIVSAVETLVAPPPPSSGSGGGGTSSGSGGTSSGSGGTATPGGPGAPGPAPAGGSQSGSYAPGVAPISSGTAPFPIISGTAPFRISLGIAPFRIGSGTAPTRISSPPPGLITGGAAISSEIPGPVERRGSPAAPTPSVASPTLQVGTGAVTSALPLIPTRIKVPTGRKRDLNVRRSHQSGPSSPSVLRLLSTHSEASWALIGLLALAAVVAAGLIGTELRERRAKRLS
jgi:hypothetical protein